MADGSLRNVQFVRCTGEALVARGRFEHHQAGHAGESSLQILH